MENEIVVETLDSGRHSNAYRGERACDFVDLPVEQIRKLYLPMAREKLKRLMGE